MKAREVSVMRVGFWATLVMVAMGCVSEPPSAGGGDAGARACRLSSDCGEGWYCGDGVCTRECAEDRDCADSPRGPRCDRVDGRCAPDGDAGTLEVIDPERRFPVTSVFVAGGSRGVDSGGGLPCEWMAERGANDAALALGVDANREVTAMTVVTPGGRCAMDARSSARALMLLWAGGLSMDVVERAALAQSIEALDLSELEQVVGRAGGVTQALRSTSLTRWAAGRLQALLVSLCGGAVVRADRQVAGLGVTLQDNDNDGVDIGKAEFDEARRVYRVRIGLRPWVREVKAVVANGQVHYLHPRLEIELPCGLPDAAVPLRSFVDLEFPSSSPRTVQVQVVAPALVGAVRELVRGEVLSGRGEEYLGTTIQRSLIVQVGFILRSLIGTFIDDLVQSRGPRAACFQAFAESVCAVVRPVTASLFNAGSPDAVRAAIFDDEGLIFGTLSFISDLRSLSESAQCSGVFTEALELGAFEVIERYLDAARQTGMNACGVLQLTTGRTLSTHQVDLCAACLLPSQSGPIPACAATSSGLQCATGSCDPRRVGEVCEEGVGACRFQGRVACVSGAERCEGSRPPPRAEVCGNGVDEDCDGADLPCPPCGGNPMLGDPCTVGQGACRNTGTYVCGSDGRVACSATAGASSTETCNNRDDDCDGMTDEALTRQCYGGPSGTENVGRCRAGTQSCGVGAWGACSGAVLPVTEVCGNGVDDDCDGEVDDGCVSCGANWCRSSGFDSGDHCDGSARVTCGVRGGCVEELSRVTCPTGCQAGACRVCESNPCQVAGRTSGSLCSGSELISCGASGGCAVVTSRDTCGNGCDQSVGRCITCTSDYCQDRGYRSGTYCDGNTEVTCGVNGACGVVAFSRACGSVGCSGGRCGACPSNYCQSSGQSSGAWCDGSSVVECATDGPCRREASRTPCPGGCTGGRCGMTTTRVFQQGYEDRSLFNDTISGQQRFTDGEQFWDACGTSSVRFGSAYVGSGALNFYCRCGNTTHSFPAPARSDETLRVRFWAYNPFTSSTQVHLQRAGGDRSTITVPPQAWTQLSADLRSTLSTSDVIMHLSDVPTSGVGFSLRIDEVTVDRF